MCFFGVFVASVELSHQQLFENTSQKTTTPCPIRIHTLKLFGFLCTFYVEELQFNLVASCLHLGKSLWDQKSAKREICLLCLLRVYPCAMVALCAPQMTPKVPQGSPKDPKRHPKGAPGTPKRHPEGAPGTLQTPRMIHFVIPCC